MELIIIIVNYRTAQLTCNCIHSLSKEIRSGKDYVFVVDNNSKDNSLEIISNMIKRNGYSTWVKLLPSMKNNGFASGNNKALNHMFSLYPTAKYIWLLNPDTIVKRNASKYLMTFMRNHPTVGIAGSRLEDLDGTIQVSAFRYHSIFGEFLSGMRLGWLDKLFAKWLVAPIDANISEHRSEWVAGASMMVRREVFEQVGFFDESYFMYYEEEDFCKAANNAGWQCWYIPESRVVHLIGAASGFSDHRKEQPRRPTYWFESRSRFFLKNFGTLTLIMADIAWITGYALWQLRRIIQKKKSNLPPYYFYDFLKHSIFCKGYRMQ